jgi:dTDP-4-dehydrorhamnose reductase
MMLRVGVIGGRGQLGRYLARELRKNGIAEVLALDRSQLDVTDREAIEPVLASQAMDVVINTAAYHAADSEEKVRESFLVNAVGPRYLAAACAARGVDFVHVSTDYVFSGRARRPYVETSRPEPLSIYGISKLAGELAVRHTSERHYVVRVAGLYGVGGCRGKRDTNFVEVILEKASHGEEIRVVRDQICSPTYALDAARTITQLITTGRFGIYHVTNQGSCSWFDFAREIIRLSGRDADCIPIATDDDASTIRRPRNTSLDNRNLRRIGLSEPRHWRDALCAYLEERERARG